MLELLERAGVVTQRGARYEPTRIGERRSGGTVELTAFGVVTVVEHVRSAGVTVETIDSPESLTAQDLADLADNQTVDVDVWWDALVRWRAGQGDPRHALAAVFDSMGPATVLSVLTDEMPDGLADDVAFVLRDAFDTRGPDDPVAVAALWWLFDHGLLDLEEVSPHTVEMSRLALIGLVVEAEPESVDKHWGAGQSRPELLAEVAEIARLMPANVEALLEAIGSPLPGCDRLQERPPRAPEGAQRTGQPAPGMRGGSGRPGAHSPRVRAQGGGERADAAARRPVRPVNPS